MWTQPDTGRFDDPDSLALIQPGINSPTGQYKTLPHDIDDIVRRIFSEPSEVLSHPQALLGLSHHAQQLVLVGGACKKNGNTGKKVRPPRWYLGVSH